jgi:hypothetical protein
VLGVRKYKSNSKGNSFALTGSAREIPRLAGEGASLRDDAVETFIVHQLLPADTESVGDAIDVVEPGGDERDLQDGAVVESGGAQFIVIVLPHFCCIFR